MVDSATKERRAQVKKDLASIITKPPNAHPHPGAHAAQANAGGNVGATDPFPVVFPASVPAQPTQPAQPVSGLSGRRSVSFELDQLNSKLEPSSVACPICGENFQSERVLAVHIDDSHGLGSVIGPNASGKKQVHFASGNHRASGGPAPPAERTGRDALNSSIDALDLSFTSPLGKSRSVDDIRKKDDDFGFEGFGMSHKAKTELPKR